MIPYDFCKTQPFFGQFKGVETAYVDGQVEKAPQRWSRRSPQLDGLADPEDGRNTCVSCLTLGLSNRQPSDVRPHHVEAMTRKVDRVGPRPTADVECAARRNLAVFDEFDQLWRCNAGVPPGLTEEVPEVPPNPADHGWIPCSGKLSG